MELPLHTLNYDLPFFVSPTSISNEREKEPKSFFFLYQLSFIMT